RLRDAPVLELPTDRSRPPVQSYAGRRLHFEVPAPVAESLRSLCRRRRVSLFAGVLAVFDLLLSRYTNQADVLVGTPVSGRSRVELEPLIGFFLNTLVLRLDLGGDPTFSELLEKTAAATTEALAHADLPFEVLVDDLKPARDPSRSP